MGNKKLTLSPAAPEAQSRLHTSLPHLGSFLESNYTWISVHGITYSLPLKTGYMCADEQGGGFLRQTNVQENEVVES